MRLRGRIPVSILIPLHKVASSDPSRLQLERPEVARNGSYDKTHDLFMLGPTLTLTHLLK